MANNNNLNEFFFNELFKNAANQVAFTARVKDTLEMLNEDMRKRILAYLINPEVLDIKISEHSVPYSNEYATFKSYNWVSNEVTYTYQQEDKRFFSNEKDANEFIESGYTYAKYSKQSTEEYSIEAIHKNTYSSYTTLNRWEENAVKNE